MAETWSCKPFISHDGGDENGVKAEVLVLKGVGFIDKIEGGDRSKKIEVKVDGLKRPIVGYINTDDPAFEIAENAHNTGEAIEFRHETQRKRGVDRKASMKSLRTDEHGNPSAPIAAENTIKLFVGFGEPGKTLTLSGQHLTDPAQDNSGGDAIAADSANAVIENTGFNMPANTGEFENKPWFGTNPDGSVNPGSYAVSCMPKMYFSLLKKFPDATDDTLKTTTEEFVKLADMMQVRIYDGKLEAPNRFYNSHLTARTILLELIETSDAGNVDINDENSRKTWEKTVAGPAYKLWKWAIADYDEFIHS